LMTPDKKNKRAVDDTEIVTWRSATVDVKPLKKKVRKVLPVPTAEELAKKPIKPKPMPIVRAAARSQYDAKLDLHGLTETGAHNLLMEFVRQEIRRGSRKLLVITGKGSSGKTGVLKANMPRWLDVAPIDRYIGSIDEAPAVLGGEGAFLVKLKKPR
jgi:dsDNA-specific endonuclease/ATPase MutS2